MRIAYFMDTPRLGGAERFLADLAAGADAAGHEVTVLSPQRFLLDYVKETAFDANFELAGRVDYFSARPGLATIASLVRAMPGLRRTIGRSRTDVLHINNGGYPGSDLSRLAALVAPFAGSPHCVLSVHNPAWSRETSQPHLQAIVDRLVWRSVDVVHATSAFVENTLSALRGMPAALGTHIPYGVAEPAGSTGEVSELRRQFSRAPSRVLLGIVAATGELHKGHAILLDALALAGVDFDLVVVGSHPGEPFLEQITRLMLEERVSVVGPVSSREVGPYLRAIDLLVVPSTGFESLPFVVLEAMAAGKPVFASSLAGIPEAVLDGETGRLFTAGSVAELAELLRQASRNPVLLGRMGAAGHERWRERFSVDAMVAAMLRLYEGFAPRARTP
jgi:glycosyltransferase involved in cell wall biosynthesis